MARATTWDRHHLHAIVTVSYSVPSAQEYFDYYARLGAHLLTRRDHLVRRSQRALSISTRSRSASRWGSVRGTFRVCDGAEACTGARHWQHRGGQVVRGDASDLRVLLSSGPRPTTPRCPPKGTYSDRITGLGSTVRRRVGVVSVGAARVLAARGHRVQDGLRGHPARHHEVRGEHMTKVSLELGGKAPAIVCAGMDSVSRLRLATGAAMALCADPADLDLAVKGIVASRICFSGQSATACRAGLRPRVDQGQVLE